jgi:hypothetical protein
LLSPEHAIGARPLPTPRVDTFVSRNKLREQEEEDPLTPLPELADLPPGFVPAPVYGPGSSTDELHHPTARAYARGAPRYQAAPVPDGVEYPPSPLQSMARTPNVIGKPQVREDGAPLSPLSVSSGLFSLKSRLPWRRNTTK